MSKSTQSTTQTPNNPFALDPNAMLEAQRKATLSSIEGLISLQGELRKTMDKGMDRARKESDSWAKMTNDLAAENLATAFDLANRALTTWRDEVQRFGAAN